MDVYKTVLNFLTNQKTTIGYSFMAALTIGGQRIFTMFSFQCPCNRSQNMMYGLTFLLAPAFVLLILGFFFSSRLWRLLTGCCLNPRKLCPRGNFLGCTFALLKVSVHAFVAPTMWLSVALLNGTFYECAVSGTDYNLIVKMFCKNETALCERELPKVPCGKTLLSPDDTNALLLMLRAQSQILGWCIIISVAAAGLAGTCYKNCRSQVSYMQLTFWKKYIDTEREKFDIYASDYATKLADRNLTSFFENRDPEAFPFPTHTAWEEVSALYNYSHSDQCYSTLQSFVEHGDRDSRPDKRPEMVALNDTF
ncbi:calcium homeostasis modulator protein 5 [Paramormyrops kingsleyae]|uniref:Calcium homeostasis modulator family member 5, tandem duplicate 1 n=1 Tax=Paramormyrops kingsleyae TaxID=1676925 RepID=A0A3B3R258_9TELE|nr:calcium homeostasis modulator protein 5-like [Paramormyrops kingsleyae]